MPTKKAYKMPVLDDAIKDLSYFRTRAEGIRAIVEDHGSKAIPRLLEVLESRAPARVRWSVVRALGDLNDASTVDALRAALDDPDLRSAAEDAIYAITGARPRSVQVDDHGKATRYSDDELIASLGAGIAAKPREGGYDLTVSGEDGRDDQVVTARFPEDADSDNAMVLVYAKTGSEARAEDYERMLRLNPRLPFGAIGIATVDGRDEFVLVDTHLRETLDPPELIRSVRSLARSAQGIRSQIAGDE